MKKADRWGLHGGRKKATGQVSLTGSITYWIILDRIHSGIAAMGPPPPVIERGNSGVKLPTLSLCRRSKTVLSGGYFKDFRRILSGVLAGISAEAVHLKCVCLGRYAKNVNFSLYR